VHKKLTIARRSRMVDNAISFLSRARRVVAARAMLRPHPCWRIGIERLAFNFLFMHRRILWELLKTPCVIKWFDGLRIYVYPGNEISRAVFLTGLYEPNEFFWLNKALERGNTFIDIGANMGLYSLFAARKVGPSGLVIAIEPSSRDFERLRSHVELNRLTNVRLLQIAASDRKGEARLLVAPDEKAGHNTLGYFGYDRVAPKAIETVRLERVDDVVRLAGLQKVDFVKLDVEGAEFRVLQGAQDTLRLSHPTILLELSDRTLRHQSCHSEQIWNFLTREGYRMYGFNGETGLPVPAKRKTYFDSENLIAIHNTSEESQATPISVTET